MTTHATYPKSIQRTSWSPVVDMIHGMELSIEGSYPLANLKRLGFGNDPKEAGR